MIRKKWLPGYSATIMNQTGMALEAVYRNPAEGPALFDLTDTLGLGYRDVPCVAYIEVQGKGRTIPAK